MTSITCKSYPRAALIGNPSDGYNGKTIAFLFSNFCASVHLQESGQLEIIPSEDDRPIYDDINDFYTQIRHHGYYGGERLIKAALNRYISYCREKALTLHDKNFSISYHSDIPRGLGLAGSSAIITATMRALMQFYKVKIPNAILANLTLSAELNELRIGAGLQDRVAQAFVNPTYMDFDINHMQQYGYGKYQNIDAKLLPPMYIGYKRDNSESSDVVHNNLRHRYDNGDSHVITQMKLLSDLTDTFYKNLKSQSSENLDELINRNFDIRKSMLRISESNQEMINKARNSGVSAKFTGSGGAIIGIYHSEEQLQLLKNNMKNIGAEVIIPKIVSQ